MKPETKIARDGTPLWRCDKCLVYRRRKELAVRSDTATVCKVCDMQYRMTTTSTSSLRVAWIFDPCPPDSNKMQQVLWHEAKPFVVQRRLKFHRDALDLGKLKKQTIQQFLTNPSIPERLREPAFQVVAEYFLGPRDNIWLVFRNDVLNNLQLRRLAIAYCEQAEWASTLSEDYPSVVDILNGLRRCVLDPDQPLHPLRENIFSMQVAMEDESYTPRKRCYAVQSIMAACLPNSRDAALFALNWAIETLMATGMSEEGAIATMNDTTREMVESWLPSFSRKLNLKPWSKIGDL